MDSICYSPPQPAYMSWKSMLLFLVFDDSLGEMANFAFPGRVSPTEVQTPVIPTRKLSISILYTLLEVQHGLGSWGNNTAKSHLPLSGAWGCAVWPVHFGLRVIKSAERKWTPWFLPVQGSFCRYTVCHWSTLRAFLTGFHSFCHMTACLTNNHQHLEV